MIVSGNYLWGPAAYGHAYTTVVFGNLTTYALDDADDSVALVFSAPYSGSITDVGIQVTAVVGTPPQYNVGVVTVSNADGYPTANPYGGSAVTLANLTPAGHHWVTLTTPATTAAGDIIAARVWPNPVGEPPSGAANVSTIIEQCLHNPYHMLPRGHYYTFFWNDAEGLLGNMAVRYSDGTIFGLPMTGFNPDFYDSADTPDEVGCVFTLPFGATCYGCRFALSGYDGPDNSAIVKLYDSADGLKASCTLTDLDQLGGYSPTYPGEYEVYWAPVFLSAGTYRLTVLATNGDLRIRPYGFTFDSAADRACLPAYDAWQKTSRTDAGAWTDEDDVQMHMAVWLSAVNL